MAKTPKLPGTEVVSAFNNIPSEVLFSVFESRARAPRPSMLYCGDQQRGKGIAATLIRDIGFDPIDLGSLSSARYTEPLAMIIAHLAYGGPEGPELTYRFERFER
jgi:8-hydroxy-5-deazaflavin:NADPH oxidoreductase